MIIILKRMNMQKLFVVLMLSKSLMACGGSEESTSPNPEAIPVAAYSYPLTVGSTERHVVDQDAKPFLLVGDSAWSLLVAISEADADMYLENRKQHGFTAVLANLIEYKYAVNAPANFYGFTPFKGRSFTTPQEAYFAHVDYVLRSASEEARAGVLRCKRRPSQT
jgi:hypothetical protein